MGRDAMKAGENICFRCRKQAAKYNDRLSSREGAAELLGVSVSSLADYELGNTKVIPVDKIVLMADLYGAPELKLWYCSQECPIGRSCKDVLPEGTSTVEQTTLKLLKWLKQDEVQSVKDTLVDITEDGVVTEDERVDLVEILEYLDGLIKAAGELRLIGSKVLNGGQV